MGKNSKRMKIDGRTYRAPLDKFLADKQLKRKSIAKDGSCLFRAVSEQVWSLVEITIRPVYLFPSL
jgi:hypothetical protein